MRGWEFTNEICRKLPERNYIKKNPNAVELKISTGITGEISEKVADGFHRNFD